MDVLEGIPVASLDYFRAASAGARPPRDFGADSNAAAVSATTRRKRDDQVPGCARHGPQIRSPREGRDDQSLRPRRRWAVWPIAEFRFTTRTGSRPIYRSNGPGGTHASCDRSRATVIFRYGARPEEALPMRFEDLDAPIAPRLGNAARAVETMTEGQAMVTAVGGDRGLIHVDRRCATAVRRPDMAAIGTTVPAAVAKGRCDA
jgi:hypothetical protein